MLTQVFGPQVDGGFRFVFVVERNSDHQRTLSMARDLAGVIKLEPWYPRVELTLQVWAWTIDGGYDFGTQVPANGSMLLQVLRAAEIRPKLQTAASWVTTGTLIGLAAYDVAAGHGTGGGRLFYFSSAGLDWQYHALHEMGHGISYSEGTKIITPAIWDEYTLPGIVSWTPPQGEPPAANHTIARTLETLKWKHLCTPGIPIPSRTLSLDPQPALPPNPLGTFEKWPGVFIPSRICRMGGIGNRYPYCKVCEETIVNAILGVPPGPPPPPPPSLSLTFRDSQGSLFSRDADPIRYRGVVHALNRWWIPDAPGGSVYHEIPTPLELS